MHAYATHAYATHAATRVILSLRMRLKKKKAYTALADTDAYTTFRIAIEFYYHYVCGSKLIYR